MTIAVACPRCDRALDSADLGWHCAGCKVDFPRIGGPPWLFPPRLVLGDEENAASLAIVIDALGDRRQRSA